MPSSQANELGERAKEERCGQLRVALAFERDGSGRGGRKPLNCLLVTTTTRGVDKLFQHPLAHDRVAAENRVKEDGREEEGESLSPSLEERRAVLG